MGRFAAVGTTAVSLRRPPTDRAARIAQIAQWLADVPTGPVELTEEERYLGLRLSTVTGDHLSGQVVTDGDRAVYASLFTTADTPAP